MAGQGKLFFACRHILRAHYRHYHCEGDFASEPTVYVCRHRYAIGPVASLCCLPDGVRPWVLSTFFDVQECKKHCVDYTFTVSWGCPRPLARLMSGVICPAFTALVHSAAAIPVYRQSLKVRETFSQSLRALDEGSCLLIFPDVDYAVEDGATGTLYDGFFLLEQMYFRKTQKHVRFVPLHIGTGSRIVAVGEPIIFTGKRPFNEEKKEMTERLVAAFDEMNRRYGA